MFSILQNQYVHATRAARVQEILGYLKLRPDAAYWSFRDSVIEVGGQAMADKYLPERPLSSQGGVLRREPLEENQQAMGGPGRSMNQGRGGNTRTDRGRSIVKHIKVLSYLNNYISFSFYYFNLPGTIPRLWTKVHFHKIHSVHLLFYSFILIVVSIIISLF